MFFIVAIITALFGFSGIAAASAEIAQFVFFIFAELLVVSLVFGIIDKKSEPKI
ncbi:DUF1328 domain-containing protein [Rickettsiales bacterium]|nr:DUF1328 domain-containing protein [Rickettsiales bacterium]